MGESVERVTLALVPAVVENCVQEVPPFKLYCQRSAVAEEDAEILNPLAVMLETEQAPWERSGQCYSGLRWWKL